MNEIQTAFGQQFLNAGTHTMDVDLLAMLLDDKRSLETKRAYRHDINQFFKYVTGEASNQRSMESFLSLSKNDALAIILKYKSHLISVEGIAEATLNRRIAAIRSLAKLGKTLGKCEFDLSEVKGEKIQSYRDTRGISLEQIKDLIKVPDLTTLKGKRDSAILQLLFETALRRGELTKLRLADYVPESHALWILGKGRGTQKEQITISSRVISSIEDYLAMRKVASKSLNSDDFLFAATDRRTFGSGLSGEAIRRVVRNCARAAGIARPISPHKIRHSSITIALDQTGGDVRSVRKLSRHKKIDTLLVYDDNRQNQQGELTDMLSSLYD